MNLSLALTTWNVGGASCAGGVPPGAGALLRGLDRGTGVIVVGLQEVARPSSGWKAALLAALPPGWAVCYGSRYAGMRVLVLVHERVARVVEPLQTMRAGTGVGDRWPNKGAVAVVLRICRTTVCFVVAHLAAQEGNVKSREEDYVNIIRRLQNEDTMYGSASVPLFKQYDHVFVMGDLNYRLAPPPAAGDSPESRVAWVEARVAARDWGALAGVDELAAERGRANVFVNYQEGPLRFAPTFKIEPGSRAGYNPARIPSYCDRILWHSLPARRPLLSQTAYESATDMRSSDHVPVRAMFLLRVPEVMSRPTLRSRRGQRVVLEFMHVRFRRRKRESTPKPSKLKQRNPIAWRMNSGTAALNSAFEARSKSLETKGERLRAASSEGLSEEEDEDDDGGSASSGDSSSGTSSASALSLSDDDFEDLNIDSDDSSSSSDEEEEEEDGCRRRSRSVRRRSVSMRRPSKPKRSSSCGVGDDATSPSSARGEYDGEAGEYGIAKSYLGGQLPFNRARRISAQSGFGSASDEDFEFSNVFRRRASKRGSKSHPMHPILPAHARAAEDRTDPQVSRLQEQLREKEAKRQLAAASSAAEEMPALPRLTMHARSFSGPGALQHVCYSGSGGLTTDGADEPVKRDSLTHSLSQMSYSDAEIAEGGSVKRGKQLKKQGSKRRKLTSGGWMMDVHGTSVFLKPRRIYRAEVKKRKDGSHTCVGDALPAIPLHPVNSLDDLVYDHCQISFWRAKSRVGTSGVLPLGDVVAQAPAAGGGPRTLSFELPLTKYGAPAGVLEASVRLVVSDSVLWVDGAGRVVRAADGGRAKNVRGPLAARKAEDGASALSLSSKAARTAQKARAAKTVVAHRLDSLGSERGESPSARRADK